MAGNTHHRQQPGSIDTDRGNVRAMAVVSGCRGRRLLERGYHRLGAGGTHIAFPGSIHDTAPAPTDEDEARSGRRRERNLVGTFGIDKR